MQKVINPVSAVALFLMLVSTPSFGMQRLGKALIETRSQAAKGITSRLIAPARLTIPGGAVDKCSYYDGRFASEGAARAWIAGAARVSKKRAYDDLTSEIETILKKGMALEPIPPVPTAPIVGVGGLTLVVPGDDHWYKAPLAFRVLGNLHLVRGKGPTDHRPFILSDLSPRKLNFFDATRYCEALGGSLPTRGQLLAFRINSGGDYPELWSSEAKSSYAAFTSFGESRSTDGGYDVRCVYAVKLDDAIKKEAITPVIRDDENWNRVPEELRAMGPENMKVIRDPNGRVAPFILGPVAPRLMTHGEAEAYCATLGHDGSLPTEEQFKALTRAMDLGWGYNPDIISGMKYHTFWTKTLWSRKSSRSPNEPVFAIQFNGSSASFSSETVTADLFGFYTRSVRCIYPVVGL